MGIDPEHLERSVSHLGDSNYTRDLANKYGRREDMYVWNYLELVSFGGIIALYKFYFYDLRRERSQEAESVKQLLFPVKALRNAAAHNGNVLNTIGQRLQKPVGSIATAAREELGIDQELVALTKRFPVIHDFTFTAEPGQTVAIVGPTGAGKTTLIKLVQRFYDVDAGAIRVDGVDVRDWDLAALRSEFAMVLQDTWLFNGTIRENIRYGRPDATDEEVEAAARAARCEHFIHTLAGGYDFVINEEGTNLSQGQRQLVTIARAVLADRPALILDEATSNVDTRTEELIQRAMDELMRGRTSFVIAHRLSTIKSADTILVLRDGDIVEQGTHEELLAAGGFYAELYNSQFEE